MRNVFRPVSFGGACVLILLAAGCSGVGVKRAHGPALFEAWRASAFGDNVSPRTLQTLRRWDLDAAYHADAADAFRTLQGLAEKAPHAELLFALAEIGHVLGRRNEKHNCCSSIGYYYLCAGYAYHYLFDRGVKGLDPDASPFDPRFRVACELYNAGLAKCVRAAQRFGRLDARHELRLPDCDGQGFTLSVVHHGFRWKPEEFGALVFCEDFQTVGLANHHRSYGLGVPLIAVRSPDAPPPGHALYPPLVSFPATAFFRFEGTLADLRAQRTGRLELYNPLAVRAIRVNDVATPLETDLTTPLAYFLTQLGLDAVTLTGFLRPDKVQGLSGIYMLEPYQPGKVPVVFVHGLLSSPMTWAPLFNDLRADPYLRERFQFWFYLYPTANPYLATAADLRDALARLRAELGGAAPDDMVLVGHSMGGLVSKLLTVDSGDDFWRLVSDRPLDELEASDEARQALARVFHFERQPCVSRVVFLGTPHRGSKLSPSLPARVARRFIRLPKNVLGVMRDVVAANPDSLHGLHPDRAPTSLDLLAPGAPALEVLAERPPPPGVHYHSVIGVAPPSPFVWAAKWLAGAGRCEEGDGVVPYGSARLDDADSELVVPAEHMEVHHHPQAVQEVRRILLEHAKAREAASGSKLVP